MKKVCDFCGGKKIRVISWIESLHRNCYFCNMTCKHGFIKKLVSDIIEVQDESKESILPEVRELIAHKTKEGITVMRCSGKV